MLTLGHIFTPMGVLLSWFHNRYAWATMSLQRPLWMDLPGQRLLAFAASLLGWLGGAILWSAAGRPYSRASALSSSRWWPSSSVRSASRVLRISGSVAKRSALL